MESGLSECFRLHFLRYIPKRCVVKQKFIPIAEYLRFLRVSVHCFNCVWALGFRDLIAQLLFSVVLAGQLSFG